MWQDELDRWSRELLKSDYGVAAYNDNNDSEHCSLGVLMESAMTNSHKYTPTMRDRFRNLRERFGIWVGSKISGYDLTPDYY